MKLSVLSAGLCLTLASSLAIAQPKTSEVIASTPQVAVPSNAIMKGINVNAVYSMANNWEITGKVLWVDAKLTLETESAPGIGLRYANVKSNAIGFIGGASYFLNREIKNLTAEAAGKSYTARPPEGEAPKFSLLTLEPNVTLGIGQNFYLLAGPNYVVPFKSGNWEDFDIKGDLGGQVGAGIAVSNFFAELQYQALNPKIEIPMLLTDQSRLWGFTARAGTTF